jgi:hypothetical protein
MASLLRRGAWRNSAFGGAHAAAERMKLACAAHAARRRSGRTSRAARTHEHQQQRTNDTKNE